MKKHRLMQITHDLAIGGLQQVVVNICKTIDRSKFDISVLCLRTLGDFVPEVERMGIDVLSLPSSRGRVDYLSFLKVGSILRKRKIDIIHTHNTQPLFDGTMGALMSGVKTIVHTDHARGAPSAGRWRLIERQMSRFVYKFVAVSDDTAEKLVRFEKIPKDKILTILNGIDGSRYSGIGINEEQLRKELRLLPEGPIIGLGVRLSEQKGIQFLLRAMPRVIEKFPTVTLVVAGRGPLRDQLVNEAKSLGVHSHVRFIGPRLDIPALLKLFDIYVLPSLWEGLPMVLLEAMSAGCPIIATKVGGVPTAIHDGQNGRLVAPGNVEHLANAIIELLSDENLRKRYTENGIKTFENSFSATIMTRHYEKLYLREPIR